MKTKKTKLLATTILLSIFLIPTLFAVLFYNTPKAYASPDGLPGWSYRRKLTVNKALISEVLTDFPVLVKLDSSFFDFTKAKDNGEDVRFTSSDGTTLLKYEIERWDKTGGKAEIWVKLPSISNTVDTDFYIYYGNPSGTDAQDPTNVWPTSQYAMVLHLKEASGTNRADSTSNNNAGTATGITHITAGQIDGADDFSGSGSYIKVLDANSLDFGSGSFSYSFWFKSRATTTQDVLDKKGFPASPNTNAGYKMTISSVPATGFSCALADGAHNIRVDTGSAAAAYLRGTSRWGMFTCVVDRTTQKMTAYVNGTFTPFPGGGSQFPNPNDISSVGSVTNSLPLYLGRNQSLDRLFNGQLDEVRISNVARSAAWISASYNSEKNTLLTYGIEEGYGVPPSFSNIAINTTTAGGPCKFQVKWTDSDGLDKSIFSTNNTGTWQNQTIPLSGTQSWANVTQTLNSTPGTVVGYRWYANDTLGSMGDTGKRTLITTGKWPYAKKLSFKNGAISENLINFPVMINLSRAGTHFWSHVGTSYNDLRFVDSDSLTDLYFEVEYWNYAEKKAIVWVKVPQIDTGSTTDSIYVQYGNPSPPESPYLNPAQVWDSSFKMVQHLEETSNPVTDSTINHNDGTYNGATQDAPGKVDGADEFDGVNDYISVPHSTSLNLGTGDFTISVWVKYPSTATNLDSDILRKGNTLDTPTNNYKVELDNNRIAGNLYDGGDSRVMTTESYGDDKWHYVVFRREAGTIYLYVDANLKASQTGASRDVSNTATFSIASKNPPNLDDFFDGIIDEVWILNTARSQEWIEAQYASMTDQYIIFGNPPEKPTNPNPSDGSTGIPTSVPLSVKITDPDGDPMDVYFYQTSTQPEPAENFTIVLLPDTQIYSESYPAWFDNQTQWIVNNAASMNIVFVTHEGDIVNVVSTLSQWDNANHSMSKLDDSVPWGILPGNHDFTTAGDVTNYNTYFGYARFSGESWYGGAYQTNNNTNSYQLFSGEKDDYLIFHIQYNPSDAVLAWANTAISSYPNRRVIVTTHDYMSGTSRTTIGNRIWTQFIQPHADQIFLVLSGHSIGEALRTDIENGHNVYQLLANYQDRPNGGNGWLRTLSFHPAEDKIYVKTYSTYLKSFETDSNSEFTLDYDMTYTSSSPPKLIGVATNVPSGGTASVQWNGLNCSTTYQWYTVAIDPDGAAAQSDTWSFTTVPPTIESCDSTGTKKDIFNEDEIIYGNGSGYSPSKTYDLYVVKDVATWTDGKTIPSRVAGSVTTVPSDASGKILPTVIWSSPTPGKYDIVVDVNKNGKYDSVFDALDDSDIEVSAGFTVLPLGPMGNGILYVYEDSARTTEVSKDPSGNYRVLPSKTYYFKIAWINEYEYTNISVWAKYGFENKTHYDKIGNFTVGTKPSNITFEWTVPNLPITTSIRFMYGTGYKGDANKDGIVNSLDMGTINAHWAPDGGAPPWSLGYDPEVDCNDDGYINSLDIGVINGNWHKTWSYARNDVTSGLRLLLVVPEILLGSIGAIAALFAGLAIKKVTIRGKRSKQTPPNSFTS